MSAGSSNPGALPFMRRLGWLFGLAIAAGVVYSVWQNWDRLLAQHVEWSITPGYILGALAVTWAMYALLIQAWRVMLAGWRQRLAPWPAARIWTVSSLGKYVPGQVWSIASMAVMAQRVGVAPWAATASSILLQGLAVGTGALVLGVTGLRLLEGAYPLARLAVVLLIVGSVAGVALLVWPPVVRRVLALLRVRIEADVAPRLGHVLFGAFANIVAWVGYGFAFWLLARGLFAGSALTLPTAIGAFTAAYLAGFLVFGVPDGAGIREGVMITMLQGPLGLAGALALALVARLLTTVATLGAATPFLLHPGERTRVVP